ncbi:MAG: TPM domain-containing protein [Aristaeellaceae bacterium]
MVKRMIRILCLTAALLVLPCLALAGEMVVDDAGLFTQAEIRQMEEIITRIRDTYQMDAVVVTSTAPGYNDSQDFADLYYERGGYGLGDDKAGLLYLIDMRNRVPCISTSGVMIDYITDSRLNELFDCSYDQLAAGQYGQSAIALLSRLETFLRKGRQEGSFRYDAQTGRRISGIYNALTGTEALVAALAGLAVAAALYLAVTSRYSLKGGAYRYDLAGNTSCRLTRDDETFLRQNVIRTRNAPPPQGGGHGGGHPGGGSGVHTSSSGGSHGGGVGRRF